MHPSKPFDGLCSYCTAVLSFSSVSVSVVVCCLAFLFSFVSFMHCYVQFFL